MKIKKQLITFLLTCFIVNRASAQLDSILYHDTQMESQWGSSTVNDQFGCFVRVTPTVYPATLRGIRAYFRNADAASTFKWKVYSDSSGSMNGGVTQIYISPVAIPNPSSGGIPDQQYTAYVDLTSDNLVIDSGDVYIGVVQSVAYFGAGIDNAPDNNVAVNRQWQWMNVFNVDYWNTLASQASSGQFGLTAFFTSSTIGINETGTEVGQLLFPNPATDYISIFSSQKILSVTLLNIVGERVKEFPDRSRLFIGDVPKGFYFLEMETGSGQKIIQKILVE